MPPQCYLPKNNNSEEKEERITTTMDQRFSTSPRATAQYRKNNNRNHHNTNQVRSPQRDVNNNHDQRSMGSGSAANSSSAAPNSVYLPCSMSRDLSDLSGSYVNDRTRGTQGSVPRHIYDHASYKGPWRQAYALSQIPPNQKENWAFQSSTDATILVSQNDVVEIVDSPHLVNHKHQVPVPGPGVVVSSSYNNNNNNNGKNNKNNNGQHSRIPLLVLLMDATTHSYEIMQVWVDRSSDSVRELVQCLRQSIPTTKHWKQDYDGLFQVRGNRFTQLIHILRLLKYDIQPHEILIAKPRTMTAKVTISCATSAIRHLTNIGMINTDGNDHRRLFRPKSEESPLLLSKKARDRIYEPDGFFSHHHAVQYLTFCPAFESQVYNNNNKAVGEMPLNVMTTTTASSDKDSCANSSLGSHSVVSGSATSELSAFGKGGVQLLNALGISSRTNSVAQAPPGDGFSSSKSSKSNEQGAVGGGSTPSATCNTETGINNSISSDDMNIQEGRMMRRSFVGGMVSKLKCCKNKDSVARHHDHHHQQQQGGSVTTFSRTPFATLSEEQEMQWSNGGFDIRPIAEDQTTISGRSTVSMSAPLLAPTAVQKHRVQPSENAFEI